MKEKMSRTGETRAEYTGKIISLDIKMKWLKSGLFNSYGYTLQQGKAADGIVDFIKREEINPPVFPAVIYFHNTPAQFRVMFD